MNLRIAACVVLSVCAPLLRAAAPSFTATYSTWAGGSGADRVTAMAVDASGNLYIGGYTDSIALNAPSLRARSGGAEAFLMKLDPAGNRVVWATFLGGSAHDQINGLTVDASGVTVVGFTTSWDFPVLNAWRAVPQGSSDAFVARFDTAGGLVFSTYLGGTGEDQATAVALAPAGALWVAGQTRSSNFPVVDAARGFLAGGSDAFVVRFSAAGVLQSSTYLGGGWDDGARAVAVDAAGEVYLTGSTDSNDFPVLSAFQSSRAGGSDAFVTKLSADGRTIRYSSFLGGPAREAATLETGVAIAVDAARSAVVLGTTSSLEFPVRNPLQAGYGGGDTDGFLAKIDAAGSTVLWASYLGGNGIEHPAGVALNADGSLYVAATTTSGDLPLDGAIQSAKPPTYDGYLWKLSAGLTRVIAGTYLSGSSDDSVAAMVVAGGSIHLAGDSSSLNLLAGLSPAGLLDGFTMRLREEELAVQFSTLDPALTYTVTGDGCAAATYTGLAVLRWRLGAACWVTIPTPQAAGDLRRRFVRWQDGSTANPRMFEAAPGAVLFGIESANDYRITRIVSPAGAGTVGAAPDSADGWWAAGTALTLSAVPAAGYAFTQWSTGSVAPAVAFTVTGPATYTANFACAYALSRSTVSVGDAAGEFTVDVSTSGPCAWTASSQSAWITLASAASGTGPATVRFLASANDGGARSGSVTVAGKQVTVTQGVPAQVAVTIATNPAGLAWSVSGANCAAGNYAGQTTLSWRVGAVCTVAATAVQGGPDTRRVFANWSDGSTAATRTITASATASYTAAFGTQHRVVTSAGAGGSVTPAGESWHAEGASVQFTASPSAGYSFSRWAGALAGSAASVQRAVSGPMSAAAEFTALPACTISPAEPALNVGSSGASKTLTFTTLQTSCLWTASSNQPWVQVYPTSGPGAGWTGIRIYPNFGTRTRTATVRLGDKSIPIAQAAATAPYEERLAGLMYFNFFGRIGGPEEVAFHAGTLRGGLAYGQMVLNFFNSEEFNIGGRFIAGLYVGLLNRDAEFGGWLFQRNALSTGLVNPVQLVTNFIGAPEYRTNFGNPVDDEFVRLLYRYILLREPSQPEVAFHSGTLKGMLTRTDLASNFLNSAEFRKGTGPRLTAFLLYACILMRDGTQQERGSLIRQIESGAAVRVLIDEFLATTEFSDVLR